MFGISCAPELFQKVMESIIAGLPGVVVYLDDLLVTGNTPEEHDERLRNLLHRLASYGILLNKEKCILNAKRLDFLGYELSSEGIRPKESRVAAIQSFRVPQNVSELRSFLGLVTYVGRFIPNLADKIETLRSLLRAGEKFVWDEHRQRCFEEIKQAISDTNYLGYYDPKDRCIVIADASPTGLGAVLLQQDKYSKTRIIAFASKTLTDLERKYCQTEREALGLVWAVDKFQLYLLGTQFKLITDCKPLLYLFKERAKPCARIERWVLRLQCYRYEVEYKPGQENLADAISRLATTEAAEFDVATEACIYQIAVTVIPDAVTLQEVEEESISDSVIQDVFRSLQEGVWTGDTREFKPFNTELCRVGNLLLRGDRLVIPNSLRPRTLQIAHESHPGMEVMKRRLRLKVWWPHLDKDVEKYVKQCRSCTLVSAQNPPEPLQTTKMPDRPWADLAADFLGPLPTGHYLLVIVDYFSRFTEIIVMKQITAALTVRALHETFCRFGFPESLKTDNGPQFISSEIQRFCSQFGIDHRKTTPYWPQANGEVERMNRSIVKRLKISQETDGSDWQWDLRMFLLMHNSTPHSTTGAPPSTLMFGRVLKDKLPGMVTTGHKILEEIVDRDAEKKLKGAEYTNKRRQAKSSQLEIGDTVVAKRVQKENKLSTTFDPDELTVIGKAGSSVTVRSQDTGRTFNRNISHLKKLPIGDIGV